MRNRDISRTLKLLGNLLDLHEGDPARVKSYQSAAFQVDRMTSPVSDFPSSEISEKVKIGKAPAGSIKELIETGTIGELEELLSKTPAGVLELFSLKGIGPKKIGVLWKELGIETPGELLYACKENRLLKLKGFGEKTQAQIISAIEFRTSGDGSYLYAQVEDTAERALSWLNENYPGEKFAMAGEVRRRELTVKEITIIGTVTEPDLSSFINPLGIPVNLIPSVPARFGTDLFIHTGAGEHIGSLSPGEEEDEARIYQKAGLPFLPPELRDFPAGTGKSLLEKAGGRLLETTDIRGILHAHSTYSDGLNTLEEMATACRDKGFEYFGICDHSKAAFYAGGLKEEQVFEQQKEIVRLNEKLHPFKIFSGIEADILSDGSLDYGPDILKTFDFVVASVHSNLKMKEEKAMDRLLKAIENPHTTILGHMTGRLLLSRPGYPIDHQKIVDACAANGVVIELNANPHRLDMDWEHIPYALEKGVMISVNPDAHSIAEIDYIRYGVLAGRKGGLFAGMTFNVLGAEAVSAHFSARRENRL